MSGNQFQLLLIMALVDERSMVSQGTIPLTNSTLHGKPLLILSSAKDQDYCGSPVPAERSCCGSPVPAERSCCGSPGTAERSCCGSPVPAERNCCGSLVPAERSCCGSPVPAERSCCGSPVPAERNCCGSPGTAVVLQYLPKPTKWGMKVIVLADRKSAYTIDWEL